MNESIPGTTEAPVDENGRRENDFYATPQPWADAICARLSNLLPCQLIIEPSAGSGNFARAARRYWPSIPIHANELLDRHRPALREVADAVTTVDWVQFELRMAKGVGPRLVLGNPPYSDAQQHVEHALAILEHHDSVAFLLRLSFIGSQERANTIWAKPGLRFVLPVAERPKFAPSKKTGKMASDNSEYAVFVWTKGFTGTAQLILPHVWVADGKVER